MIHKRIDQVLFILILVSIFLSLNAKPEVIKLKYTSFLEKGFTKEECLEVLKGEIYNSLKYEADNMRDEYEVQFLIIDKYHLNARYILLFRNNVLEFWGFPHEFARHDNQLYNKVADFCAEEFKLEIEETRLKKVEKENEQKRSIGISE